MIAIYILIRHGRSRMSYSCLTLRLIMPASSTFSRIMCNSESKATPLRVHIDGTVLSNDIIWYKIRLHISGTRLQWTILRRYSDFVRLDIQLQASLIHPVAHECFGCRWFMRSLRGFIFPRKHFLRSKCEGVIDSRRHQLEEYCRLLAQHTFSSIPKCVQCSDQAFKLVQSFFTMGAIAHDGILLVQVQNMLTPRAFAVISDPKKSKIVFKKSCGIVEMVQLES